MKRKRSKIKYWEYGAVYLKNIFQRRYIYFVYVYANIVSENMFRSFMSIYVMYVVPQIVDMAGIFQKYCSDYSAIYSDVKLAA